MALLAGIAICVGPLVGFLAGFRFVKRTQQWCPGCGAPITTSHCPHPISAGPPAVARHPAATPSLRASVL